MIQSENLLRLVKEALDQNKPDQALLLLENPDVSGSAEALYLKGEIYFKLERWGDALNSFNNYLVQFPSDKKAESYCSMIHNILGFFHKDQYNP